MPKQSTADAEREAVLKAKYVAGTLTVDERSELAELLEQAV